MSAALCSGGCSGLRSTSWPPAASRLINRVLEVDREGEEVTLTLYDLPSTATICLRPRSSAVFDRVEPHHPCVIASEAKQSQVTTTPRPLGIASSRAALLAMTSFLLSEVLRHLIENRSSELPPCFSINRAVEIRLRPRPCPRATLPAPKLPFE
jgi:hypothetical protein